MRDMATRTLETLGMLYGTAFGTEGWARVLDAIAELIGGNGALLFVNDAEHSELQVSAMSTRYQPADVERYLTSLVADDEARWLHVLNEEPPRTIKSDADIWPDRSVYDAMPSVRFMRALHLYHRVAVRPCAHGGWKDALTILFDDRRGGIRPAESRRLALLVPHLAHAIEMQRPFQLLLRRFGGVLAVLDRLGIGVLIARESGEIVISNQEAERILEAGDGLRRGAGSRVAVSAPTRRRDWARRCIAQRAQHGSKRREAARRSRCRAGRASMTLSRLRFPSLKMPLPAFSSAGFPFRIVKPRSTTGSLRFAKTPTRSLPSTIVAAGPAPTIVNGALMSRSPFSAPPNAVGGRVRK
jgi:hypothetical protein